MSTDNVRGQGHYQPTYQKARGVNLFYSPPINFHIAIKPLVNIVKKPLLLWWRNCVIDVSKQVHLIGLTNFIGTVIGPKLNKLSCEINSHNAPYIKNSKTRRFWFIFSDVLSKDLIRKKCVSVSVNNQIISSVTARTEKRNYIQEMQNVLSLEHLRDWR